MVTDGALIEPWWWRLSLDECLPLPWLTSPSICDGGTLPRSPLCGLSDWSDSPINTQAETSPCWSGHRQRSGHPQSLADEWTPPLWLPVWLPVFLVWSNHSC